MFSSTFFKRILLVEDDVFFARMELRELEKYGYETIHVNNGEEAIQMITENSLDVDLILMDIDLGQGLDGTEAAERILKHKDIPIVFLSSHTEPEVVEKTEKLISYGYVAKTSGIVVLDASIKMAWKLYQAKVEMQITNQTLKKSEELFKTILNEIPSVSVQGFTLDGTVLYWNKASEEIYGYSAEEAIGKNLLDLIIPTKARDLVNRFIERVAVTGNPTSSEEFLLMRKDGRPIEVNSSLFLIHIPGKDRELICIDIDLTKQKEAEDEIQNQLLKKEILIREIHHRVLSNISAIEEYLINEAYITGNPEADKVLHDIIYRIKNMRILYRNILSCRETKDFSLQSYIDDIVSSIAKLFQSKNIKIEKSIQDINISPDKAMYIGIIINELMTNIFKYAYREGEDGDANISLSKDRDITKLIIQDSGRGTFTDHNKNKPNRFGITMVKLLVEQLGGSYHMATENGVTNTIELAI
jgi:PAS domain S-box-containing protein